MREPPTLNLDELPRSRTVAEVLGLPREQQGLYQGQKLEALDLSTRTLNCLRKRRTHNLSEVLELTLGDLFRIRNMGRRSVEELLLQLDRFSAAAGQISPTSGAAKSAATRHYPAAPAEELDEERPLRDLLQAEVAPEGLETSIEVLRLSKRPQNRLVYARVQTIHQLLEATLGDLLVIPGMGRTSAREILERLYLYCNDPGSACPQVAPAAEGGTIEAFIQEQLTTQSLPLEELIAMVAVHCQCTPQHARRVIERSVSLLVLNEQVIWTAEADVWALLQSGRVRSFSALLWQALTHICGTRNAEILDARYGLRAEPLTLRRAGRLFGMTQEGVRQAIRASLQRIKRNRKAWELLLQPFRKLLPAFGNLGRLSTISTALVDDSANRWGEIRPEGYLRLVSEACPEVCISRGTPEPMLTHEPMCLVRAQELLRRAQAYVKATGEPVASPALEEALCSWWTEIFPELPPPTTHRTEVLYLGGSVLQKQGRWALAGWKWVDPQNSTQKLVAALQMLGQPSGYAAIAEQYRRRFEPVDDHDAYRLLQSRPDLFHLYATGVYGLVEWNLSHADWILQRVLGTPASTREC